MSLQDTSAALAEIVARTQGSVVRIETDSRGGGSGIAWSEDKVVTPAHLLPELSRDEPDARVGLPNGELIPARLIGRDTGTDLAVLALEQAQLPVPRWDESGGLEVGHLVVSVGRPGRVARAALGMISALSDAAAILSGVAGTERYSVTGTSRLDRWIELDGGIPAGFTGAAVVKADGSLIGLANPLLVRSVALAVPASTIRRVVQELIAHGKVQRGYLGVGVYPVQLPAAAEAELGRPTGAMVVAVEPQGPADKSGLVLGDVLLSIDGVAIASPRELTQTLATRIDAECAVQLLRGGQRVTLTVRTGTRG